MMYVPSSVPDDFWQKITAGVKNIRLMVKVRMGIPFSRGELADGTLGCRQRVFITDDLGADYLPQWLRFLNIVVDGELHETSICLL
jgi:heat shock protein beta